MKRPPGRLPAWLLVPALASGQLTHPRRTVRIRLKHLLENAMYLILPCPTRVLLTIAAACATAPLFAADGPNHSKPEKPIKKLILPGEAFLVDENPAFVLMPEPAKRTTPQPWVLYGPTLPGYPDKAEQWMHEQFLAAGVAVAGIDVGEAYGSPQGVEGFNRLYDELTERRGFSKRPCLLGRSRGGLLVSSWAIANPDKVAGLAGIYPVYDWRTYPGVAKAAPAYGLSVDELVAKQAELNPIARVDVIAKAKVPVLLIHGDVDTVVPLEQNSQALASAYDAAGAKDLVTLVVPQGQGHTMWEGFFRCQPLVDFVIKRAKAGTAAR